jgi:hypothetical protein
MKMFLTILCIVFLAALPCSGEALELPGGGFSEGWEKAGAPLRFVRNDLYGHIDGGAELFLELGFEDLTLGKYSRGKSELSVEAYRMDGPEAALGIYLLKCGKETPVAGVPARNTGDVYQIMALKGRYFVLVNNFSGEKSNETALLALAVRTLEKIPDEKPGPLLSLLPEKNRVPGSERLLRGPYSLQTLGTLGEGDVLLLKGKIFAASADYKDGNDETYTEIRVRYPDAQYAAGAYSHLLSSLDPLLRVVEKKDNAFSFKDQAGKFGAASFEGEVLTIKLNSAKKWTLDRSPSGE